MSTRTVPGFPLSHPSTIDAEGVEKPMDKLLEAYDGVKAAGVVVQVGTNSRSSPAPVRCRELYQSGILGKASRIEQCRNGEKPYWYHYLKDVRKEDVDWDEFLMDAPKRPFDAGVYSGWYGYREFSEGPIPGPDHFLDWLQCLRSGKTPVAPIEAGYQHSVACIMAVQSYDTGRRTIYDHQTREIREG